MAGNSTVAAMTAASALSGSELFYVNQGGNDRKATATQIQTFIGSGLTIGSTTITGGTTTRFLYDLAGVVSETAGLTYGSGAQLTLSTNGAASIPPFTFTGTWFSGGSATTTKPQFLIEPTGTTSTGWSTSGTGIGVNAASGFAGNLLDLQVAGTSKLNVSNAGTLHTTTYLVTGANGLAMYSNPFSETTLLSYFLNSGISLVSTSFVSWRNATFDGSGDLFLYRDAANSLAQRNGTNAQTLNIYNTWANGGTDFERATIAWSSNILLIGSAKAGAGSARTVVVGSNPAGNADAPLLFNGTSIDFYGTGGVRYWTMTSSGHLLAGTDNTYDIGASGGTRPRDYFGAGKATILAATAIPAGGTAGSGYKFSSTANFGVFFGSGAPSLAAAKGSLYLRSDGSTTNDRAYVNTDGSTTWTALTTAA